MKQFSPKSYYRGLKRRQFRVFVSIVLFLCICSCKTLTRGKWISVTKSSFTVYQDQAKPAINSQKQSFQSPMVAGLSDFLYDVTKRQQNIKPPVVIVLAVNYAYRELAMNFVCNLHRLGISDYLIFAMDRSSYNFMLSMRANVFLSDGGNSSQQYMRPEERQDREDSFGSPRFIRTSQKKSALVLEVLRLGCSVVFSDVDVAWVRNPIPFLSSIDGDIIIQSDRRYAHFNEPLNFNLNSGLYLARCNPRTISAMRAVIRYAKAIRRSEQKGFNYVLCGAFKNDHNGPGRRVGSAKCIYPRAGTITSVLPLDLFPNGSNKDLWHASEAFTERHSAIIAAHANYIVGRKEKVESLRKIGFWFYGRDAAGANTCFLQQRNDT